MKIISITTLLALLTVASAFATVIVEGVVVTDSNEHYLQYVRHMTVPIESQSGAVWDAGNEVGGKTDAQIQAIVNDIKALETDDVQKEIFAKMKSVQTEIFAFAVADHAKAAVFQRLETINMMINFNDDGRYTYHQGNPS